MGPVDYHVFSDAPAMVLPASQASPFDPIDTSKSSFSSFAASNSTTLSSGPSNITSPSSPGPNSIAHRTSWTPTTATTPVFTNPSRKRSRDESALIEDEESPDPYFPLTPAPPSIPEEEPIYGEGMTLLNPKRGVTISADSQTGTWYEEAAEAAATKTTNTSEHPELQSRKSQRLDVTAPGLDDIAVAVAQTDSPPKSAPIEPVIDESTQALGIGWMRVSDSDPDLQAAARGWAKYIENHYPHAVHGAKLMLKSNGLNAYLVSAEEGFFLFKEDLSEGRLVSRTWEQTVSNLIPGGATVIFEGETMTAREVSASSPGATLDEKVMVEAGEPAQTNGHLSTEDKVMVVEEAAADSTTHGLPEEVKSTTENTTVNHGHVDGGMDLD